VPRVFVYAALLAWAVTFAGLIWTVGRGIASFRRQ